jgi:membrane protein required for colicin V production
LTRVNGIDLVILVIVGFSAVMGLQRGFMLGMIDLLVFGLALVAGARLIDLVAAPLRERGIPDPLAASAGFVVAAVIAYAAMGLAVRIILAPLSAFGAGTPLAWVNSMLGLLPGVLRGLALAALLIIALSATPLEIGLRQQLDASQLAEPLAISGREALNEGLAWAGVDPHTLGLPNFTLDPVSDG